MGIGATLKNIFSSVKFLPFDLGESDISLILVGMGRSGTTWAGNIINYDNDYRVLFEPFLPAKVNEAKGFKYIQYLNPDCINMTLANHASIILAGKIQNDWVDRGNSRFFYRHRMLKDIRCNLMIGWLKKVANNPPVVFMIRHPLQVVSSWKKLGWGKEVAGNNSDFDIIMSQESLLRDFPIISEIVKEINREDFVQNIVFQWCIHHLIPSIHLRRQEDYALYYENLITDPDQEVDKLFRYLEKPFNNKKVKKILGNASSTNFQQRDFRKSNTVNSWKDEFSDSQVERTNEILAAFGLDNIYDTNGFPTGETIFKL
ncbi:MAG: hypothetical protein C0616_11865 [Desulfuromonas sp.]|nr:MAG: hypothetical protein C0616_11865 [Desulfuromonas sp.]